MLLELKVENFAIISSLLFCPGSGMNVISGETGAGKSLIADALSALILGQTGEEMVRSGTDNAKITGLFQTNGITQKKTNDLLLSKGLRPETDGQILLSCEIKKSGRSVFRINGEICSRSFIQEIGSFLADIHGQSDHLSLLNATKHLEILDTFCHTSEKAHLFALGYQTLKQNIENYRARQVWLNERSSQIDFLTFQLNEIKHAKLKAGEEEELLTRQKILCQTESLKVSCAEAFQAVNGDGLSHSAVNNIATAASLIEHLSQKDPSLKGLAQRLLAITVELEDCASTISEYSDHLEFSPQALEEIELRLSQIRLLKRKYGVDVPTILEKACSIEEELTLLSTSKEDLSALREQIKAELSSLGSLGEDLLLERQKGAKKLQQAVQAELADLDMGSVDFKVDFICLEASNGLPFSDTKRYAYNENGVGSVQFMVKTNLGEDFKPLNRIASTGEMSRFTLALKGALSQSGQTPTLVFDEIDIGVGARSGHLLGRKIFDISRERQVICVTHLAQIAAYAQNHFKVHKASSNGVTYSTMRLLKDHEIIEELGIMLSGTQSSVKEMAAKELRQVATDYRESSAQ